MNGTETMDEEEIHGGGLGKYNPQVGNDNAFMENLMSSTTTSEVEGSEVWDMSLFDNLEDENTYVKEVEEAYPVKVFDISQTKKSLKAQAMEELKLEKRPPTAAGEKKKKSKGANMLDMLDEAVARPATAKKNIKGKRSESTGPPKTASKPATDENAKPRPRSGSRPTTGARPKTGTKTEGRAEARPTTKSTNRAPSKTVSASRPTTGSRPATGSRPSTKAGNGSVERAGSATPKRAGSAKKKKDPP